MRNDSAHAIAAMANYLSDEANPQEVAANLRFASQQLALMGLRHTEEFPVNGNDLADIVWQLNQMADHLQPNM